MDYFQSLIGGGLIGLAAAALLLLNGRTAGVSGIADGLLSGVLAPLRRRGDPSIVENTAFIGGLLLGPFVYLAFFGALPTATITDALPLLVLGGLLVGFGTRQAGGCTSGHGVCGMARLSRRSIAAVAIFFGMAIVTVFAMEHLA